MSLLEENVTNSTLIKERNAAVDMKRIQQSLEECNIIKYAAYRTAAKCRVLQRALHMDTVRLSLIAGVLSRHHLLKTENHLQLDASKLEAVIFDIFFAAQKENMSQYDVDINTETMMNLLHKIYCRDQDRRLQLFSVKVVLTVLSSAGLQEKYQYLFNQLTDTKQCITAKELETLLRNLAQIAEYLSESVSFGSHLIGSVMEDFYFKMPENDVIITEEIFINWLLKEPHILVWLSTLYRMQVSELVTHNVKCSMCKIYPIAGLRYVCLVCLRYNQCQMCFFMGKLNKRHKLRHPMQEYCYEISPRETTLAFLKMLKNKLCGNSSDLQYISVQPYDVVPQSGGNVGDDVLNRSGVPSEEQEHLLDEMELTSQTIIHGSRQKLGYQPQKELESIVSNLEEANRHLQWCSDKLDIKQKNVLDHIRNHQLKVEAQIERLKLLKHHLPQSFSPARQEDPSYVQSTPLSSVIQRDVCRKIINNSAFATISPIVKESTAGSLTNELKQLKLSSECSFKDKNIPDSTRNENPPPPPAAAAAAAAAEIKEGNSPPLPSLSEVSMTDLSTWIADRGSSLKQSGFSTWIEASSITSTHDPKVQHESLDVLMSRLQRLASSLSLEETFTARDNVQLKEAAREIEDLLTGLVRTVELQKKHVPEGTSTVCC